MSVRLRAVRKQDERFFTRWWHDPRLIHLTSGDQRTLSSTKARELFERLRLSRSAQHWLVMLGRRPIGHVTVRGRRPAEIQIMIGEPTLWGRGYGTAIATELKTRLARAGITWARMYVWRQNRRSIALGRKFGFSLAGQVQRHVGTRERVYLKLDWHRSDDVSQIAK